jgi:hypothetical protein
MGSAFSYRTNYTDWRKRTKPAAASTFGAPEAAETWLILMLNSDITIIALGKARPHNAGALSPKPVDKSVDGRFEATTNPRVWPVLHAMPRFYAPVKPLILRLHGAHVREVR